MLRVVIDTNCLRASIPPKSPFYQLYLDFMAGKFEWFVSTEILLEYDEILTDTYSQKTSQLVLNQLAIAPNVVFANKSTSDRNRRVIHLEFSDMDLPYGLNWRESSNYHTLKP